MEKNLENKNKLYLLLGQLKVAERRRFLEFVDSPYFNKNKKVRQFSQLILQKIATKQVIENASVYQELFGAERYKEQRISDLMTYLYRLYEKFMLQEYQSSLEAERQIDLLAAFRTCGMDKLFQAKLGKVKTKEPLGNATSSERYFLQYRIEKESDLFFMRQDSRSADKSIERKSHQLDLFYLVSKLKDCCEMVNRENIVNEQFDIQMMEEVKQYVTENLDQFETQPAILIYHRILLTLQESEQEEHYDLLVKILKENTKDISQPELRAMYDYAQNYCIKKINSGNIQYVREIFNLYKRLVGQKIIFENGELSQWDYKNIVTVGTRLKEFQWTTHFIEQHKERIPEGDRENAYSFNLASLYYAQANYDKALRLLQKVEFTDLYYSLSARSLLLKAYYESGEVESLFSLFDSFKVFLSRNKLISNYQKTVHANLIKLTKRLTSLKIKSVSARKETMKRDVEKLKTKINTTTEVTNLNWLLEKIEELENGYAKSLG